MKHDQHLVTKGWEDYELLDSGENMKLERYGSIILARPETEALWAKQRPELWESAHAIFKFEDGKGAWHLAEVLAEVKPPKSGPRFNLREGWELARGPLKFLARLGSFKHTGVFPEQEPNWTWIADRVNDFVNRSLHPNILNLFGYTGIATLAAAHAGAFVTHVDASKQSLDWAHENARFTGLAETAVRWIPDDALAFAKRELRRGAKYDGIILDPPAFGRGSKGEVWKIEESLPDLLTTLSSLLSDSPGSFFLLNGYAAGYAPLSFAQAIESVFPSTALGVNSESGELRIQESQSNRAIPAGIYVRLTR